jgi:hypothetical protein
LGDGFGADNILAEIGQYEESLNFLFFSLAIKSLKYLQGYNKYILQNVYPVTTPTVL